MIELPKMNRYEDIEPLPLEVPETYNFAFDVIDARAQQADKTAFIAVDPSGERSDRHGFSDLSRASNRFAGAINVGVCVSGRHVPSAVCAQTDTPFKHRPGEPAILFLVAVLRVIAVIKYFFPGCEVSPECGSYALDLQIGLGLPADLP